MIFSFLLFVYLFAHSIKHLSLLICILTYTFQTVHTHTVCRDTIDLITTHSYGLCLLSLATCSCWVRVSSRTPRRPGCFEINSPPAGPTFLIAHTLSRLSSFYLLFGLTSVVVLSFSLSLIFLFLFSPSLNYILFTIFLPSPPPRSPSTLIVFPSSCVSEQTATLTNRQPDNYLFPQEYIWLSRRLRVYSRWALFRLTNSTADAHTHSDTYTHTHSKPHSSELIWNAFFSSQPCYDERSRSASDCLRSRSMSVMQTNRQSDEGK